MDANELKEVLDRHRKWLNGEVGGVRANLRGANLRGANLRGANLRGANLRGANLSGANLRRADLSGANLSGANLSGVNLSGADLSGANLSGANLRRGDLSGANLSGADLCRADLRWADLCEADLCRADLRWANLCEADLGWADLCEADLRGVDLYWVNLYGADLVNANLDHVLWDSSTLFFSLQCPEKGAYIGYKKANGLIVELEIPADALRSSATTRKCRASKAKVLSITNADGSFAGDCVASGHDPNFLYVVGETVEVQDFDRDRWRECAPGIHHFITRAEAVQYQ